jgi:methyl-accepting chemotaxis protein WspA
VRTTGEQICEQVKDLAATMDEVARTSVESGEIASSGLRGLEDITATMESLLAASNEITQKLHLVREKTGAITQIITTITAVANQTNLLSLNASIEAEKAGDYGAGFSVVATEIRRLADRTAVSALDIESMITEMELAITDGVAGVENYFRMTRDSSEKTARISRELSGIIEHSREVAPRYEAINSGMQLQSQRAMQISDAMEQLNITAIQVRDSLIEFKSVTDRLNDAVLSMESLKLLAVGTPVRTDTRSL